MKGRIEATVVVPVRVVEIIHRKIGRDAVVLEIGGKDLRFYAGDILEATGDIRYEFSK